jgi:hypothetical protein
MFRRPRMVGWGGWWRKNCRKKNTPRMGWAVGVASEQPASEAISPRGVTVYSCTPRVGYVTPSCGGDLLDDVEAASTQEREVGGDSLLQTRCSGVFSIAAVSALRSLRRLCFFRRFQNQSQARSSRKSASSASSAEGTRLPSKKETSMATIKASSFAKDSEVFGALKQIKTYASRKVGIFLLASCVEPGYLLL